MNKVTLIALFLSSSLFSLNTIAASVTIKWVGVVPSVNCASKPISNQTDFKVLNEQCRSEFKQELVTFDAATKKLKNTVSFDI
ncbi:hypothetical protein ACPV47_18785 [Vibrio jasicida]|uniref:hypothetical protein n=1 Tax=Vibrio jasicida TaxID=766224 RepID=UPI004067822B